MSYQSNEVYLGNADILQQHVSDRTLSFLSTCSIVRFSEKVGFSEIFSGEIPISAQTIVYDKRGERLDTLELLSQVSEQGVN